MISAKEAQRLTKTRWQAELTKLDKLVRRAIGNNLYSIEYTGKLLPDTIDYLNTLGYAVAVSPNKVTINWAEEV